MAVEHEDADPGTRALADDAPAYERALGRLEAYRREMSARLTLAPRLRMGFLLWYSGEGRVLRYHAVKANAFVREPDLPPRLLGRHDLYAAYLLENVLPGAPEGPVRSASRLAATEGAVSALFHRWATDAGLRGSYRETASYEQFGLRAEAVAPLENVYLKIFHVLHRHRPRGLADLLAGYEESFPDESPLVAALVDEVFPGRRPAATREIWLANAALRTGTTIFDQFRGLPRLHTFDLDAASIVDLASVPGVDPTLARSIMDAAPYASIEDLLAVPGVDRALLARFQEMARAMDALRAAATATGVEDAISIRSLVPPYVRRALLVFLLAAPAATLAFRCIRALGGPARPSWPRAVVNGLGASLVSLTAGWAVGGIGLASLAAVGALFGAPAPLGCLWRTRRLSAALEVLASWLAGAIPAVLLIAPWF
jgi:hypothetical protein